MRLLRPRLLPATIVTIIALLAVKSAVLVQAAAGEAGQSMPAPVSTPQATLAKAAATATEPNAVPIVAMKAAPEMPMSDSERKVLLGLRKRRDELDLRAHLLDERQAELEAANRRLAERVAELSSLETRLEGLEAGRQQHKAENWAGLVKTYEAMKPREAAAIFDVLDMQVLLQVLDRMQERKAAPVLAAMQPDRARLATQLLAEMRTRAITPPDPAAAPTAQDLTAPKG